MSLGTDLGSDQDSYDLGVSTDGSFRGIVLRSPEKLS